MRIKAKKIKSVLGKAIGLMFSKPKSIVFIFDNERIVPLHMLFVFYSLDVLFLSKNKRVVEKAMLKPFHFYTPKHKAKYVIEMKKDAARKIKLGEKIVFA